MISDLVAWLELPHDLTGPQAAVVCSCVLGAAWVFGRLVR
jgi:hypothetical protein